MKIPITFLGTSQAIPTAKRNHTAVLIKYKDENILVDCGEGTQRQFRKAKINPCKLTRILITHWHGDHILGLPGLLQTLALNNYNKTLHIYGPAGTKKFMSLMYKLFVKVGKIKVEIKEVKGKFLETPDFYIETLPLQHGPPCNAYAFVEKDKRRLDKKKLEKLKLPQSALLSKLKQGKNVKYKGKTIKAGSVSYLEKGKKIAFILDTKLVDNCYKIAKNADLLISESTYTEKEKEDLIKKIKSKGVKNIGLQRYKGLGEMNPSQLWTTTMNPKNRILKNASIRDAVEADKTFNMLMGAEVPPRRKFIQTHAKMATLDI